MRVLTKIHIFFVIIFFSFNLNSWFQFISMQELIKQNPTVTFKKCFDLVPFNYEKFSILPSYAHHGNFLENFILTIPNGKVQSQFGFVFSDNYFLEELVWSGQPHLLKISQPIQQSDIIKVYGSVAVITNLAFFSYSHWLNEVLGALALLEMHNISYDWLYVPCQKSFMKETLKLWGIDPHKIISPDDTNFCIQADQVIVTSPMNNTDIGFKNHIGLYSHPYTLHYVRNKLLISAKKHQPKFTLSKKVFISRKDAPWRQMTNEDEIFNILKMYGFQRYELSKMSVVDQILLFNNAEIIIGEHGTGLVNTMFCKPGTKVVEIFQHLIDSSFWYLAQLFRLNYTAIKTIDFNEDCMINWSNHLDEYMIAWKSDTVISPETINQIIQNL